MQQGQRLLSAGKFEDAETRSRPRSRSIRAIAAAYVEIARVAEKQKLYGKAIRLTNKALALEPNDLDALAVQGEAMVELGAVARAQANLAKLQTICTKGCPQVAQLPAAIGRGPSGRLGQGRPEAPRRTKRAAAARARRTRPTLNVSARRSGSIPSFRSASSAPGTRLQARAQHLAPLAERRPRSVARSSPGRLPSGVVRGTMWTTADVTLGGGTKAERLTRHRDCRARRATGRRPTAGRRPRCPGAATIRSATSFWNIRVSDRHHGGHSAARASAAAARCRHCRAGWRRHAAPSPTAARFVDLERVALDELEPVRDIRCSSSASAGRQRRSRSTATTRRRLRARRGSGRRGRVRPHRPCDPRAVAGNGRDPRQQLAVEDEILARAPCSR